MKAILLAAGIGSRLRPITDTLPKCLVPILGKPLLGYWFDLLEQHGVSDVLINTHYLHEQVDDYAMQYEGAMNIACVYEPELLGSAGTIAHNRSFVKREEQFYILYADNLTDVNLSALREFNTSHPAALTVGLFHAENPAASGIVQLDENGWVVDFQEKPAEPKGDLASAGVFVARQSLFDYIAPTSRPHDLGTHVMPQMVGMMNATLIDGYLRDIGSLSSLERAEREFSNRHPSILSDGHNLTT